MTDIVNVHLARTIQAMKDDNINSWPDMLELHASNWYVPLFVYASEQREMSEHFRLKRAQSLYQGRGVTIERGFIMSKDKKWASPLVFNQPKAPTAAHIFGEVYLVEPEIIYELDSFYERGQFTRRHRRSVSYVDPSDTRKRRFISSCFIYTHIYDMFKEKVKNGDYELMRSIIDFDTNVPMFRWFASDDRPNMERLAKIREASLKIKAEQVDARAM